MPRPITKLWINGIRITPRIDHEKLYIIDKAAWYGYTLYINAAYPSYLQQEVENRYGNQTIKIVPSNHNKYKRDRMEHPEWFKIK